MANAKVVEVVNPSSLRAFLTVEVYLALLKRAGLVNGLPHLVLTSDLENQESVKR